MHILHVHVDISLIWIYVCLKVWNVYITTIDFLLEEHIGKMWTMKSFLNEAHAI